MLARTAAVEGASAVRSPSYLAENNVNKFLCIPGGCFFAYTCIIGLSAVRGPHFTAHQNKASSTPSIAHELLDHASGRQYTCCVLCSVTMSLHAAWCFPLVCCGMTV